MGAVSGQKQHVEINRKLAIRRWLLPKAAPGALYLPYCGEGDIAAQLYQGWRIYGCDLKEEYRTKLSGAELRKTDAEQWAFSDVTEAFSVADFDAYGNPYKSFAVFWAGAEKNFPLVAFFTDGLKLKLQRGDTIYQWEKMGFVSSKSLNEARRQYNYWLAGEVLRWLSRIIHPARITEVKFGLRKAMVYWGCVIEK